MNDNFKKWACSLSGCDGGNISAKTWLCGIEWGQGSYGDYYEKELPQEISEGSVCSTVKEYDWKKSITYPYGLSFAKLYMAIHGQKVESYKNVVDFNGQELFKLNLYPIAFDSTDHGLWKKNKLDKITTFENKYLYKVWCFFNRFPYFSKLRKKHEPKLIICTGVDYLRDFLMFFGADNVEMVGTGTISPQSETNKYDRTYYWVRLDRNTLLVVIPFFSGRYGLNSNYLLQQMGKRISELLNSKES